MMKYLSYTLLIITFITSCNTQEEANESFSYTPTDYDKPAIDKESGHLFETVDFSVRLPNEWGVIEQNGPHTDSLGRMYSDAYFATTNNEVDQIAFGRVSIDRYGYEIDVAKEILDFTNKIRYDGYLVSINEITEEDALFGKKLCRKIVLAYKYENDDNTYISTVYYFSQSSNSFIAHIEFALEDEAAFKDIFPLINQTFQIKPYE